METKIYFKDLTMNEKINLITVWKNLSLANYSSHAIEKMNNLGITRGMIEEAWNVNHIIEYKVKNDRPRMVVRGIYSHLCDSDFMDNGTNRVNIGKKLCYVCLVVDMLTGDLVTCYASPVATATLYRKNNKRYETHMNNNLQKNLELVLNNLK